MNKKSKVTIFLILGSLFLTSGIVLGADCKKEKFYEKDSSCVCPSNTQKCPAENDYFYCREKCWCDSYEVFKSSPSCDCEDNNMLCRKKTTGDYTCMILCSGDWVTPEKYDSLKEDEENSNNAKNDDNDTKTESGSVAKNDDNDTKTSGGNTASNGSGLQNPIAMNSFSDLIEAVADWLFNIGLILTPLMFVIGGIMFITAHGDTGKVQNAKKLMLYTAIGLIVILLAKSLVEVLNNFIQ